MDSGTEIDETLPDVVKAFLRKGAKLEEIRLDASGNWTHEGLDFENPRIISLFNRSIGRTAGGTWVLEIGTFTYPIEVEDAGYFVERVDLAQDPPLLHLSDETSEPLDLSTLRYAPEGRLYCSIKSGTFDARFKRSTYYRMAEHIEDDGGWVFMHHGRRFPIATTQSG